MFDPDDQSVNLDHPGSNVFLYYTFFAFNCENEEGGCTPEKRSLNYTPMRFQGVSPYVVPATLPVNVVGGGVGTVTSNPLGISCPSRCSKDFAGPVMLTAAPASGYYFAGWSGRGCSGTGTCTVTLNGAFGVPQPDPNETVKADFEPNTLTVAINGPGSVVSNPAGISCAPACSANFNAGQQVDLTATPTPGFYFAGWSGAGCSGAGGCTITMNGAQAVTATFLPNAMVVNMNGSGLVNLSGKLGGVTRYSSCVQSGCTTLFDRGATVTLTARGNPGNVFTGWSTTWPGASCSGAAACSGVLYSQQTVAAGFAAASINITAPIGGPFTAGNSLTIAWTASSNMTNDTFRIDLLRGGQFNTSITSGVAASAGSYAWTIPAGQALSTDYQVLITDLNNPVTATSGTFEILGTAPTAIALTSANSGVIVRGTTVPINWIYTGAAGSTVQIDLLKEGTVIRNLASNVSIGTGGTGSYNWNVAANQQIASGYSIKITTSGASDQSHNFLIIR
jgi:hypothetical protein